MTLKLEKNG